MDGTLNGLGLGIGVTSVSRQAGDLANSFYTDGYEVFDLQASYEKKNIIASLGVENLFDHDEYIPNFFFNGNTAPLTPLTVIAKFKLRLGSP
jgi:outer membrane receptor protein involved in Fe transport